VTCSKNPVPPTPPSLHQRGRFSIKHKYLGGTEYQRLHRVAIIAIASDSPAEAQPSSWAVLKRTKARGEELVRHRIQHGLRWWG
jgi:hypothetical protein